MAETTPAGELVQISTIYQDRSARARELRAQGKKIMGYLCGLVPLELLTALDIVPVRLIGDPKESTDEVDNYIEPLACSFFRNCFGLALKGKYDYLDGLVIPHSCDVAQKSYPIWYENCRPPYIHFLNLPHMTYASSHEFFKRELVVFKKSLEEFAGRQITEQSLKQAIEVHNENRELLRELYDLRKEDPPLLSGMEATQIVVAGTSIPVAEHNALLRNVLSQLRDRKGKAGEKRIRIMVYGCEVDNTHFMQLIEESGADVVIDDLCVGTKNFWRNLEVTGDPFDGIATHYIANSRCPRYYWPKKGTHQDDLDNRFKYILDYARDFKVDGVISFIIRYCDTFEFDVPDVRDYLQQAGIPFLHIEDEYNMSGAARLKTRCQAFVEMISEKERR